MDTYVERRRTIRATRITTDTTVDDIPGAIEAGDSILYPTETGGFQVLPTDGYLIEVSDGTYRPDSTMSFEHDWAPAAD